VIDLHCHLLPGIDDGAATLEDALALARALVEDGVTQVVATPHWTPGVFDNRRQAIYAEADKFAAALRAFNIPLQLHAACEVRLSADLLDLMVADELAYLGQHQGFKVLLLEMPDAQIPPGTDRLVRALLDKRIRPLIVHPERNKAVMDQPERLRPLMEMGCLVQVTAASVLGEFGSKALATAQALLDLGWVHVLASDAHNLRGRRPRMQAARELLAQQLGEERARWMTETYPAQLLGGNAAR